MKLRASERLLALLVEHPQGSEAQAGPDAAARDELMRRGHIIDTVDANGKAMQSVAPSARAREAAGATAPAVWRLRCAREHFAPQRFESARRARLGEPLEVWETCDSTNRLAREAAEASAPGGAVWVTERQTGGRGRQGRTWICPAHRGLLFSVLLRPPSVPIDRPQLLPLAVAVGVCEGARRATQTDVRIKWPNDLVVEGRKLGGILVEARWTPRRHVIVGCGLNVRVTAESLRQAGLHDATSLHAHAGRVPEREMLLAHVLEHVEAQYMAWCRSDHDALLEAWSRFDALRDQRVRVQLRQRIFEGVAAGVDPDGSLRLRLDDGGSECFVAGEVHLV